MKRRKKYLYESLDEAGEAFNELMTVLRDYFQTPIYVMFGWLAWIIKRCTR